MIRFTGIPEGEYILKEIEAPMGYRLSDTEYLIRVAPLQAVATMQQIQAGESGLGVWYAEKVNGQEEPVWELIEENTELWLWNKKEEHILTVKKVATGDKAPKDAEYEFLIRFFDDQNDYFRVMDKEGMAAVAADVEILNLTDIDTELQENGYYRFVLKDGEHIAFDYGSYFVQDDEWPEALAEDVSSAPALQFHLIETDNQGALATTITTVGTFGTDILAPEDSGKEIQDSLGSDSEDVVVTYTNAFGNKDKGKDKDRDRDRDKEKDKEDSPVIPEDPMQRSSEPEASALAAPAPTMPKTGGLGTGLFLAIGGLLAGAGIYLRRR